MVRSFPEAHQARTTFSKAACLSYNLRVVGLIVLSDVILEIAPLLKFARAVKFDESILKSV